MNKAGSLLDELRTQYESARESTQEHADVESFQAIDARLRKAFRWLEKAVTYLGGLKPPIDHRFDLGHGVVFESPRFGHGSVGQHQHRIVGFPVLDEINIYYEISASKPVSLEGFRNGRSGREGARRGRAPVHEPTGGVLGRKRAQVFLFRSARDPGESLVPC